MDMYMRLLIILICFLSYYLYHYNFFKYLDIMISNSKNKYKVYIIYSLFNYLIFIICTYLRLHLIINWTIFTLILFIEIKITYKTSIIKNLFYSLNCSIIGLAINIFFRSLMSITLDMPAYLFDSNYITNIYRVYSISSSFIVTGLYFCYKNHKNNQINFDTVLEDKKNLNFLLSLMFVMYLYLCLSLSIYYTVGNVLILKLYGIKSAIIVLVGNYIAEKYSFRITQIKSYDIKNQLEYLESIKTEHEINKLNDIVYTDLLTGFYNRPFVNQKLSEWMSNHYKFTLCFTDLNRLKLVNDNFGHQFGDKYISTTAKIIKKLINVENSLLFRYGGDEFLFLLQDTSCIEAEKIMIDINYELSKLSNTDEYPYALSISYGLVEWDGISDIETLIAEADSLMYENKLKNKSTLN
ncbi:diguanylate kinase signaling protein [Clostridioides difficile]|uniref:Diguanylate kinase signaling protein n=5 Tax=Clostridioides difficile TaxID=1496 RepID=A0AAX3H1E1_CLODI|nr:GGDEF domain-containing protein [Clostridioides difficile]EFH08542.1 diguanylate cyclase (GGDEF) domain protein [Clostridioides difficile NAP08]EFH14196.1 diguanylate cyclase (GGDEF) domain protein [Clostridioides difficile NAP07]CCK89361.1 Putative diguanylate kinase signaling protein [Clostridioides difficile T5]CCK92870.1 Putative diguanylate kinase signaling protein [Clostridioides difficile T20]CCK96498.1 Putative diguanylate kinase signaling protein [Clostridioides difficile E1]SHO34